MGIAKDTKTFWDDGNVRAKEGLRQAEQKLKGAEDAVEETFKKTRTASIDPSPQIILMNKLKSANTIPLKRRRYKVRRWEDDLGMRQRSRQSRDGCVGRVSQRPEQLQ